MCPSPVSPHPQAKAQQAFLQAKIQQSRLATSKAQREVYVGNLIPGTITRDQILRFFNESMAAVFPDGGRPVYHINMHTGGKYCFVEFKDPEMTELALELDGFQLLGNSITVARPNKLKSS